MARICYDRIARDRASRFEIDCALLLLASHSAVSAHRPGRSETNAMILLLSSEPVVRTAIKEVLEHAGHVVLATGSLEVAVQTLAQGKIGLLITHPYIDNITGHQAAKYLQARNPKMGVLIVAGLLDDDRLKYRADVEGFEIFPRPFTAAQLIEKVAEVLKTAQERAAHIS